MDRQFFRIRVAAAIITSFAAAVYFFWTFDVVPGAGYLLAGMLVLILAISLIERSKKACLYIQKNELKFLIGGITLMLVGIALFAATAVSESQTPSNRGGPLPLVPLVGSISVATLGMVVAVLPAYLTLITRIRHRDAATNPKNTKKL
ncbi:MAG TPA: hypothetical protein VHU87_13840 [Rhizomicrobium sp.]|jgi:hypothetical protein|nr:hypothetical protein [Rhizomicrobium sp.]